jgi:hypothetical protein
VTAPLSPRSLEVRPTYRRRRLWPWIAAAGTLLLLGLWEARVLRRDRPAQVGEPASGSASARAEPARARVEGRVLTGDGKAAPGVTVVAQPAGVEGRTGDDGRFGLEVEEGTPLRLEAHHSDLGFGVAEVRAPVAGVQLRLQPRSGLAVTVVSGGRPVPGAEVTIRQPGADAGVFHADRTTDEAGRLRFLGLPGGPLEVEAVLPATGARGTASWEGSDGGVAPLRVILP